MGINMSWQEWEFRSVRAPVPDSRMTYVVWFSGKPAPLSDENMKRYKR